MKVLAVSFLAAVFSSSISSIAEAQDFEPTFGPTYEPTFAPTFATTDAETPGPTQAPVAVPTLAPAELSTPAPVTVPTLAPVELSTPAPTQAPTPAPNTPEPTPGGGSSATPIPTPNPTSPPTPSPATEAPVPQPTQAAVSALAGICVANSLLSGGKLSASEGELLCSENGDRRFGFSPDGFLEYWIDETKVWNLDDIEGGVTLFMRVGGYLVVKDANEVVLWTSRQDDGRLMNWIENSVLKIDGIGPRLEGPTGEMITWVFEQAPVSTLPGGCITDPAHQLSKSRKLTASNGDLMCYANDENRRLGFSVDGDLEYWSNGAKVWNLGIEGGEALFMRPLGFLVIKDINGAKLWTSRRDDGELMNTIADSTLMIDGKGPRLEAPNGNVTWVFDQTLFLICQLER